jgi:magnesium transporter
MLPSIPAPSSSLLKFLRAQTKADFFSANTRCLNNVATTSRRRPVAVTSLVTGSAPNLGKQFSTGQRSHAVVEASFIPSFDLQWTRSRSNNASTELLSKASPRRKIYLAPHDVASSSFSSVSRSQSPTGARWRQIFDLKKQLPPKGKAASTSGLNEGIESGMYLGKALAGKSGNELVMRCTEFDECGNVTLVNGEFKKSELIAKASLDREGL